MGQGIEWMVKRFRIVQAVHLQNMERMMGTALILSGKGPRSSSRVSWIGRALFDAQVAAWHDEGRGKVQKSHRDELRTRNNGEGVGKGGSSRQDMCEEWNGRATEEHSGRKFPVGIDCDAAETTMEWFAGHLHGTCEEGRSTGCQLSQDGSSGVTRSRH